MQERLTPLDWESYIDYLNSTIALKQKSHKSRFSLQGLSKQLGYNSPRSLAMVLNGYRLPSSQMVTRLSDLLSHSDKEHRWFTLTVELEREKRKPKGDPSAILDQLKQVRGENYTVKYLNYEQFRVIAEWYHVVLKKLVGSANFQNNPTWIARKLRGKVTKKEIKDGLRRLVSEGIITTSENGTLMEQAFFVQTEADVANKAARRHHKEMMARASEALEEQDVLLREFDSKTIAVDPKRLPEMKSFMREFRDEFMKRFSVQESDEIYQLNMQFFAHTKSGD